MAKSNWFILGVLTFILFFVCCSSGPIIIDEGIFDHVEYRTTGFGGEDVTIIYWEDGRTHIFRDIVKIQMQSGHCYRIIKPSTFERIQIMEVNPTEGEL
jgi:hypothetical protein